MEYEQAYFAGELPALEDELADQVSDATAEQHDQRDNGRDINPRAYQHAG